MAERTHLRCLACGSLRMPAAFGIEDDARYAGDYAPVYEAELAVQTIGGRGRCSWAGQSLPMPFAEALRDRLKQALAQLELEIENPTG
jgi:hypothetical protein